MNLSPCSKRDYVNCRRRHFFVWGYLL
jgi:hypothetical protein